MIRTGSVPERVLVGEIHIPQQSVRIDTLARQGYGDEKEWKRATGDKKVLGLAFDKVMRPNAHAK